MSWRRPDRWAAALLLLLAASPAAAGPRIVAVGDIHGAYDAATAILREAGLVGAAGHWAGGDAVFVQTGDFLDRGADALRVAWWLKGLQEEAAAAGGRVVVLLGNHEVMNLMGDRRYVTPEIVAPLIDKESEARRRKMCKTHAALVRKRVRALGREPLASYQLKESCLAEHPPGLAEYVDALEADAPLGKWLRTLPAVVRLGDVVFVHGGISPQLAGKSVEEINAKVREELAGFDAYRGWLLKEERIISAADLFYIARVIHEINMLTGEGSETETEYPVDLDAFFELDRWYLRWDFGPFWFRGYTTWTDEEAATALPPILDGLGAKHFVVGHSPQEKLRIVKRFDSRVFLIDTGMLAEYYGGVPAALEIVDGRFEAIYLDGRVTLHEP